VHIFVPSAFITAILLGSGAIDRSTQPCIIPDAEIQLRLQRLRELGPRQREFFDEAVLLRETARARGLVTVIKQAALYSSAKDNWRAGEYKTFQYAVWMLVSGRDRASDVLVAGALVPYLDCDDAQLRGFVESYLATGTPGGPHDSPSHPAVRALIDYSHERGQDYTGRVVQLLYRTAPSAGLLALGGLWSANNESEHRSLLYAEHTVADAVWREGAFLTEAELTEALTELDKLAKHEGWWVKLYVAEMLRRHEMFRRDDILQRLRNDPNPLVAKAADVPYYGGMTEDEYKAWKKTIPGIKVR
jgi:hypothetical protein